MSALADNPLLLYNMAQFPAKNFETMSKNLSILWGINRLSAIVNILLSFTNMAQLIARYVHTKSDNVPL